MGPLSVMLIVLRVSLELEYVIKCKEEVGLLCLSSPSYSRARVSSSVRKRWVLAL